MSQNGYTLTPLTKPGKDFRFNVTGPDGKPVTEYDVAHDKKLHFIVVSPRPGRLPAPAPDARPATASGRSSWRCPSRAPTERSPTSPPPARTADPGRRPAGPRRLRAEGAAAAGRTATVDGYTVTLDGELRPATRAASR